MGWASSRETTRAEDIAYCLLGIFGVHIPLLYGEGGARAFRRLQAEILRTSTDQSILAFSYIVHFDEQWGEVTEADSVLAIHPRAFETGPLDARPRQPHEREMALTVDGGLRFNALIARATPVGGDGPGRLPTSDYIIVLSCSFAGDPLSRPGLLVRELPGENEEGLYARADNQVLRISPEDEVNEDEIAVRFMGGLAVVVFRVSDLAVHTVILVPSESVVRKAWAGREWPLLRLADSPTIYGRAWRRRRPAVSFVGIGSVGDHGDTVKLGALVSHFEDGGKPVEIAWGVTGCNASSSQPIGPSHDESRPWCAFSGYPLGFAEPPASGASCLRPSGIEIHASVKYRSFLGRFCIEMNIWESESGVSEEERDTFGVS